MSPWARPLLEFTSLLLVAWCAADAARRGPRPVLELTAGGLLGLAVEQAAIWGSRSAGRPDAYQYGPFAWMITPDVPLTVMLSWGALLYAAMKYSDSLGIPRWLRPAADGLYALALDLSMDVVAVNLGLWHWATPPHAQWFGVPYSNFGGWLLLAALFSLGVRGVRRLAGPQAPWPAYAARLGGLVVGLAVLTTRLFSRLFTGTEGDVWVVGLLALLAAALVTGGLLWRRRTAPAALQAALADAPPPSPGWDPALGLPLGWHISYLGLAALTGIFAQRLIILFLTGVLAAAGVLLVAGLAPVRRP